MISVIIPTYNRASTITNCLESLKEQSFSDYEVIIVDGNSKDNSRDIINEFIKGDNRFRLIINDISSPVTPHNVIMGLKEAKGEYITYVDSDDTVDKEFLSYMYHLISTYDTDIAQISFKRNNELDNKEDIKVYKDKKYNKLKKNIFKETRTYSRCQRIHKRYLIDNVIKYYSLYHDIIWEDPIFTFSLFLEAKSFVKSSRGLYTYNFTRNNDCPKRIYNSDYFVRLEKEHNININIFKDYKMSLYQAYLVPITPIYEYYVECISSNSSRKIFYSNKFIRKCIYHYKYRKGASYSKFFIFKLIYIFHLPRVISKSLLK